MGRKPEWVSDQREILNNDAHMTQNQNHVCLSCASLPVEIGPLQIRGNQCMRPRKKLCAFDMKLKSPVGNKRKEKAK